MAEGSRDLVKGQGHQGGQGQQVWENPSGPPSSGLQTPPPLHTLPTIAMPQDRTVGHDLPPARLRFTVHLRLGGPGHHDPGAPRSGSGIGG